MCCPGCQAVAMAIIDGGLQGFYKYRSATAEKPDRNNKSLDHYDLAAVQEEFVKVGDTGNYIATLSIKGITCSACAWLIEKFLLDVQGVVNVQVNVSTHRCVLEWNPQEVKLSSLLSALDAIGYQARPSSDEQFLLQREKENKAALLRMGLAGLAMMQTGMVAISLYAGDFYGIEYRWQSLLRWVSFLLVTPVVFYSAKPFFVAAWRSLRLRHLVMDVPVALAIALAYSASIWATVSGSGNVYFDSVAMFTFFLLLGRYLEMRVRHRNDNLATGFNSLIPPVATRVSPDGDLVVPVKSLACGDRVRVGSGDTIPCDGIVVQGTSAVIEAVLTGEQKPASKMIGSAVSAGTVNVANPLAITVTAVGKQTRLAAILSLADSAALEKPKQAQLADRLSAIFVTTVLAVAIVVGVVWWFVNPAKIIWVVLSVLVVTCPCALSLATPAALTVATGVLRRRGLLIRKSHVLETLAKVNHCVLDKTGTLTLGQMKIVKVTPLSNIDAETVLSLAAGLEKGSAHPIAKAFAKVTSPVSNFRQITVSPGEAVCGNFQGHTYAIGKPAFVLACTDTLLAGKTLAEDYAENSLLFARDRELLAWITLTDDVRPGAGELVRALQSMSISMELLSGDNPRAVATLASTVGINTWQAGATPTQKLKHLQTLQAQGKCVLMVGDGINDIPVLSASDVSVAMGDAADLTRLHADSILVSGNLNALSFACDLAHRTRQVIRQNLTWALLYNSAALPLACLGLIPPWAAAIGMSGSSLLVVINALRLNENNKPSNAGYVASAKKQSPASTILPEQKVSAYKSI